MNFPNSFKMTLVPQNTNLHHSKYYTVDQQSISTIYFTPSLRSKYILVKIHLMISSSYLCKNLQARMSIFRNLILNFNSEARSISCYCTKMFHKKFSYHKIFYSSLVQNRFSNKNIRLYLRSWYTYLHILLCLFGHMGVL